MLQKSIDTEKLSIKDKHLQDLGCSWPECNCKVPDYAFSEHNRRKYCEVLKILTKTEE